MGYVSTLDPTGLVPAGCAHGLAKHPDPARDKYLRTYLGRTGTFIRSRYLTSKGRALVINCPVCRGEPRPDDLTAGYAVELGDVR